MFPIELIGHLARIMSLSVRLFGNIFGKEMVLAILFGLAGLYLRPPADHVFGDTGMLYPGPRIHALIHNVFCGCNGARPLKRIEGFRNTFVKRSIFRLSFYETINLISFNLRKKAINNY